MAGIRRENAGQRRTRLAIQPGSCTWCAKPIESKRPRSWCGPGCVAAFKQVNHTAEIRKGAWARCHGRCQACGRDLARLEAMLARHRERAKRGTPYRGMCHLEYGSPEYKAALFAAQAENARMLKRRIRHEALVKAYLVGQGFKPGGARERWTTWEADHVTPVEHGALPDDPLNIAVMCKPCHGAKTARQARERGTRRKTVSAGNG